MKQHTNILLPIWLALAISIGVLIGAQFVESPISTAKHGGNVEKLREVVLSIDKNYVDSVNLAQLVDDGIKGMLQELDPHTSYIPGSEIDKVNAQLKGSYDGIGIEFDLINDTIVVVRPSPEGPSYTAGIQVGDRIIAVNGEVVTGVNISTKGVTDRLLGKKNSQVEVKVYRPQKDSTFTFNLQRGSIHQQTVNAYYMFDASTGYLKLSRFGSTSYKEVSDAIIELKEQGMQQLVFDLQGNPGGYMEAAEKIADEFIKDNQVIVSQKGNQGRFDDEFKGSDKGLFEDRPVIVLIDEYSASASEIVAGAMQDNDRALIVGRRSFGKGLVQMPIKLNDGSELRLTIARYYTPSGRSIQKSYTNGKMDYAHDISTRYNHGEFFHADSIQFADSLRYKTIGGRTVYGGGGIMPDYFVPLDTARASGFYNKLLNSKVLRTFTINYYLKNKEKLHAMPFNEFNRQFTWNQTMFQSLAKLSTAFDIELDKYAYSSSRELISTYCKAEIARLVWGENEFYQIMNPVANKAFESSLQLFEASAQLSGSL